MRSDESELLQALHDGMFEQPLWATFLDRLRVRADARFVTLLFRPPGEAGVVELSAGEAPRGGLRHLIAEGFRQEEAPYARMREGRVYTLEELVDPADPGQAARLHDYAAAIDRGQTRLTRVTEPSGVSAWLGCAGGRHAGSTIGAILAGLVPHLRIALRSFIALERERFRSSVTSEAFRRLNYGWLTLDARCRIVDMAPYMEPLFQRTSVLRRGRYDRLTPVSAAIDRQLTALVADFAADPSARPKAINLSRDPLIDMLVGPVQDRSISARSLPAVAIAYISGDRLSQADRCDQLVDLFGLLPSEARLAWAIAQGMTIAEAAGDLGLTVETARSYSKKIYAKTGSRGQAELVRNILTSVLALA